jgi:hypothetical protein
MNTNQQQTPPLNFIITKPIAHADGTILAAGSCLSVEKAESEKDRFVGTSDLGKYYWLCPLHDWFMN